MKKSSIFFICTAHARNFTYGESEPEEYLLWSLSWCGCCLLFEFYAVREQAVKCPLDSPLVAV